MWLFWLTVAVSATATYKADTYSLTLFFATALGMILITDVFKVFTASKLKYLLTDRFLVLINKIAGVGLVLFGFFVIIRSIMGF